MFHGERQAIWQKHFRQTLPPENVYSRLSFPLSLSICCPIHYCLCPPLQQFFGPSLSHMLCFSSVPSLGAWSALSDNKTSAGKCSGPLYLHAGTQGISAGPQRSSRPPTYSGNRLDHSAFSVIGRDEMMLQREFADSPLFVSLSLFV